MSENTNINIMAIADLFEDQILQALPKFNSLNRKKGLPDVSESNLYKGSKAYLELLNSKNVDAVLISSPSYTHAQFFEAVVAAGKHVYCEKPAAIDVAGCNKVKQVGERINGKLSSVFGFEIRHATPYMEMVKRIHSGDIGDVVNGQLFYLASQLPVRNFKNMNSDEAIVRNHYQFERLCGGILTEQAIHMLDVCNWALKSHPESAIGTAGNKGGPSFGDTLRNYQLIYQYPQDIRVSLHATQFGPYWGDVCAKFIGTKGTAEAHYSGGVFINGEHPWDSNVAKGTEELTAEQKAAGIFLSSLQDADPNKVKTFISSIETGKYLNEARSCAESTITAILGRSAAKAGKTVTWNEVASSNEKIEHGINLRQFDK
jgi:predicted dehydrogenase